MSDYDYTQTRSFNLGIAKDTSIEAALVYDELLFWAGKTTNKQGWVFKTYEDMMERLPLSKYQLREAYKKLQAKGYIEFKLMKAMGAPTLHFRVLLSLKPTRKKHTTPSQPRMFKNSTMESEKTAQTMESEKTAHSINSNYNYLTSAGSEKVEKDVDHRGQHSPTKERIKELLKTGGVKELAKLTGG